MSRQDRWLKRDRNARSAEKDRSGNRTVEETETGGAGAGVPKPMQKTDKRAHPHEQRRGLERERRERRERREVKDDGARTVLIDTDTLAVTLAHGPHLQP